MAQTYTTGRWQVNPGSDGAFVERWAEFATWASGMPGAGTLRLMRDVRDAGVFVSSGAWEGIDAIRAWKTHPEFRERMARVLEHVDEFEPAELAVIVTAEAGASSSSPPGIEPVHAV
jgi:heme-degrading monooxygenase HmoA